MSLVYPLVSPPEVWSNVWPQPCSCYLILRAAVGNSKRANVFVSWEEFHLFPPHTLSTASDCARRCRVEERGSMQTLWPSDSTRLGDPLIKHQPSSVAPLMMCFQLRAASDHSRGFVQTVREKSEAVWGGSGALHKIYSSVRAVNKNDEQEEACSLLLSLESTAAWLWH